MISSPGVGSGLDVNSIVSQLMTAERQPLTRLQTQEKKLQTQISAYGKLRSSLDKFNTAMSNLSSTSKFELYKAASGDAKVFDATASSTAKSGSYNITANNLAQSHKMGSATSLSTATFGGTNAADSLDFTVGAQSFSVNIYNAGAGMTLSEISSAINANATNTSLSATVVTGDGGNQQLILTSKTSGYANRVQLAFGGSVTAATLNLADKNVKADGVTPIASLNELDASLSVDGFAMTRSSNSINDVITGVTLDLKAPGTTSLTVNRDTTAVSTAIKGMVDSYNELQKTVGGLKSGDLKGDSTLNNITSRVRSVLNTPTASGVYKTLGEVGILTNRTDGTLEVNQATLDKALAKDFSGVASLFGNGTDGVALRLKNVATEMLKTGAGLLDSRTKGLQERVDSNKSQQERMEYRLTLVEKNYRMQFTNLDTFMGKMNATSAFLTKQLSA